MLATLPSSLIVFHGPNPLITTVTSMVLKPIMTNNCKMKGEEPYGNSSFKIYGGDQSNRGSALVPLNPEMGTSCHKTLKEVVE